MQQFIVQIIREALNKFSAMNTREKMPKYCEGVIVVNGVSDVYNLGKLVRQSNDFARHRVNIRNVIAVRVLACLFSTVRESDMSFRELSIPAKSVLEYTGGADYKAIKTACDKLSECVLERSPCSNDEIREYTLFSTIRYEDGTIFAKFHTDLKPFFLGLKSHFTKYDLKEFLNLPSIYSQKLFEYLKSWNNCNQRVEDLKTIYLFLGVPEYVRSNFKEFRIRVLEKAHQDISRLTTLRYEWEAIKKGTGKTSPVTAIRFIFSPGRQSKNQEARKKANDKKVQEERNKLFLDSMKCSESRPGCESPKKTGKCAVCFKTRGLELPDFLIRRLPEYE